MKKIIYTCLLVLGSIFLKAQQTPAPAQQKSMLITNVVIHNGLGDLIEGGAVGFSNGLITYVGDAASAPSSFDETIDGNGQHLYPGFIAPNSTLGLVEIGAVRATRDQAEVGTLNPNVRSIIAYNAESKVTTTVRTNGVLLGQITPRSGLISGSSSIVQFDAWNWEDAVVRADDGIHINWPSMHSRSGWWAEPGPIEKNKYYEKDVAKLHAFFEKAQAYNGERNRTKSDLKLAAMQGLFNGSKQLYVHVSRLKEIEHLLSFIDKYGIKKPVIVGGYDAHLIAEELVERNIPVMLRRVHALPMAEDDDIDLPYRLPKLLAEKGVLFCLNNAGDMEQMGTRNLPFYAGTAAAYGLEKEEALTLITSNTAKILGIDDRYGSIEQGKSATFFLSEGDALDMRTNKVVAAFIDGRAISLDNHQKELYRRYKAKYEKN